MRFDGARILLWGAGGHARVVADILRARGATIVGAVDGNTDRVGTTVAGIEASIVTNDSAMRELVAAGRDLPCAATAVAVAIGDNAARLERVEWLGERCLQCVAHPSAVVSPSATLGRGTVVMPGAIVNACARIGRGVIVNTGAIVEHDCVVGDGAHLSPGSILCGASRVDRRVWLGAGAVVIPMVGVGDDSVIGAGALVSRELPGRVVAVGAPARAIRSREP